MAIEERFKLRPDALEWREIEGEVVALDTRSSTYIAVNGSGATLWPALSGGATPTELAALLRDEFGIGAAQAASDVDSFLAALHHQDLLVPEPSPA
jgi:Coenzyme PQQ synthesis protein D (PqqD)